MEKTQTTITSKPDNSTDFYIWVGIIIVIFVVIIGSFLIYWILNRKPPTSLNKEHTTILGEIAGNPCHKNSDCISRHNCISQHCVSDKLIPVRSLPNQFQIIYAFGDPKTIYYLDAVNSIITRTQPTTSFSYDSVSRILSINGQNNNNKVNITDQGHLNAGIVGHPLTIIGVPSHMQYGTTDFSVQIHDPSGSILSHKTMNVFFPQNSNDVGATPLTFIIRPFLSPVQTSYQQELPIESPHPEKSLPEQLFGRKDNFGLENFGINSSHPTVSVSL